MPANGTDLDNTWEFVQPKIARLLEKIENGINPQEYMDIYTAVYNHCQRRTPNVNENQIDFTGGSLYGMLREYILNYLRNLFKGKNKTDLKSQLQYYCHQWQRFNTSAKCLNNIFSYLNRHWIKRQNIEDKRLVADIFTLCLQSWRDYAYTPNQTDILSAIDLLITEQRDGVKTDAPLVKTLVESLVAIGFDPLDHDRLTLEFYRNQFETTYCNNLKTYYTKESEAYLTDHTIIEYMTKAETRLKEEEERVQLYLHPSSIHRIQQTAEEALISNYTTQFNDEFQALLNNDQIAEMTKMKNLLGRISGGLNPLREKFEAHVRRLGFNSVNGATTEAGDDLDPKTFIDSMLVVHKKYAEIVQQAFNNDPGFNAALDKACGDFINRNQYCISTSTTKTPEFLARYCDSLLKKSQKTLETNEKEELLNSIMIVFKYIEDKDVFQKYYSQTLAKRLVYGQSVSDDLETSMINRLKNACGYEYTSKLQKMFTDMTLSSNLNEGFKEQLQKSNSTLSKGFDFSVLVLSAGAWPFKLPLTEFVLPKELDQPFNRFRHFYSKKHNSRKLDLLFQHCKGEIKATFSKATYTFIVSTYQIGILFLFQSKDQLTHKEIAELTKLNKDILVGVLDVLVRAKVLTLSGAKKIGVDDTIYCINLNYNHKKLKLNLNIPIKNENKQENEEMEKKILEDRRMYIQAAIVRIMKARKTMTHALLMSETISQLKSRFNPVVADIKKAIDILLEKDYLARASEDNRTYHYVA